MSRSFAEALNIEDVGDATLIASDLFQASFNSAFPAPREFQLGADLVKKSAWHQYVARYTHNDGAIECVGFCNWIRYADKCGDVYLEGGMCVKKNFYRSLQKTEFVECKTHGGVAQMMMEAAAQDLNDAAAWFGYCGDHMAYRVDQRVGYQPTAHQHLIVKWTRDLDDQAKAALIESIAKIGPF
jgi:hypothetical protein